MTAGDRPHRVLAIGWLGAAAVCMSLLSGCTPVPEPVCVPELSVSPSVVAPGATVTVATERACPQEPPSEGWNVRIQPDGSTSPSTEANADAGDDGRFSVALAVPWEMPAGRAIAWITNWWDVAQCPDHASCASAEGSFSVEPDIGRCLPYDLAVSPAEASPGDTLVITAPSQGCESQLAREALGSTVYRLVLYDEARVAAARIEAPLEPDGSLHAELVIPETMTPGGGGVGVENYFDLAPCPPTAYCAGPYATVRIVD